MPKRKKVTPANYVWSLLRIALGLVFLWAFVDKLFGLGFATCRDAKTGLVEMGCSSAWLEGGSPTTGFLKFGTDGPFAEFFQSLAGNNLVDWLFMVSLLLLGVSLILGIGVRIAAVGGSLLMLLMWLATLPPENNPVVDDHIIYIGVLAGQFFTCDQQRFHIGKWWSKQSIVQRWPILR